MRRNIHSKANILLAVSLLGFSALLFGFGGLLTIINGFETFQDNRADSMFKVIGGGLMITFFIYQVYNWFTQYPSFSISHEGIVVARLFRRTLHKWGEVKDIRLTGKEPFQILFMSIGAEATTITLHSGQSVILWIDGYRNMPDMQVVLQRGENILRNGRNISALNLEVEKQTTNFDLSQLTGGIEYNGNHIFTFQGVFFYLYVLFVMALSSAIIFSTRFAIKGLLPSLLGVTAMLIPLWVMGRNFYYFVLSDNFLLVKNTLWPWRKTIYALSDIKEVVLENPPKGSISLRVITKSFQSNFYSAESLKDKTWQNFAEALRKKQITVRNEL